MKVVNTFFEKAVKHTKVYKDLEHKLRNAQQARCDVERDMKILEDRIAPISERVATVNIQRHPNPNFPIMRICVDIDRSMVEHGLMHGNDHAMIDMMGKHIGQQAVRAIMNCNFQRWER